MKDAVASLVSVVIPTYNHACYLARALQSVLDQTYANWEIIVIDNHSTDNTDEVMAGFADPRITYLKIHNNGVIAASRNAGIRAAKGEWIAFLDSDDWWAPSKLELCFSALKAGADVVYHDLSIARSLDQTIFKERIVSSEPRHPMFQALLCTGLSIPNSSVVVRRDLLIQAGSVSEKRELITLEDADTWIRLSRLTEKFIRIPKCLGYYWLDGDNTSLASNSAIMCARRTALYDQYLGELKGSERRQAEGLLAYQIGRIAYKHGDRAKAQSNLLIALSSSIEPVLRVKSVVTLVVNMISRVFS